MNTVLRSAGLRVFIPVDDHPPAHVHVRGDGLAKIDLADPSGRPKIVWTIGMTRTEQRRAFQVVVENRDFLLAR